MKTFPRTTISLAGAVIAGLLFATSTWAEKSPKMKMTTPIPEKITTPAKIESRLGTLEFPQGFPTDSTADKLYENLDFNADGSVDAWFGPTAPKGHEKNWVQTFPGSGWATVFRLYGPEKSWFDKTWKPGE